MLEIKFYNQRMVSLRLYCRNLYSRLYCRKKPKKKSENKFLLIQFCHGLSFKKFILITLSKGRETLSDILYYI